LANAGVPAPVTVQMATYFAAQVLGEAANIGELAPGKFADITVVASDSLSDAKHLAVPLMVVKGGVTVLLEPKAPFP
jgi:imidazolonepropionase-like amidohydrolase